MSLEQLSPEANGLLVPTQNSLKKQKEISSQVRLQPSQYCAVSLLKYRDQCCTRTPPRLTRFGAEFAVLYNGGELTSAFRSLTPISTLLHYSPCFLTTETNPPYFFVLLKTTGLAFPYLWVICQRASSPECAQMEMNLVQSLRTDQKFTFFGVIRIRGANEDLN